MKFKEAMAEVKELAQGDYFGLDYGYYEHATGTISTTCRVYVQRAGYLSGDTWSEAIDKLRHILDPKPYSPEEAPE